ncbi:MAG: hypothetical protein G01um101456_453 [Parcubacteria group bacterium Gr01-1014_56]|nr:MAG: hypothetical protein G01um101456_453 [Parcubacteria group bacterium Gr01-1014_56]
MVTVFRLRPLALFAGDLFFFASALWLSLLVRSVSVPTQEIFLTHAIPFSILFVVWVVVFFIAGLYESRSIILARRALSVSLLVAQIINFTIAALFFFFVPLFGIAPKTLLLVYLVISFLLVLLWRVYIFPVLGLQKAENTIVVGNTQEVQELVAALRVAPRAPAHIVEIIDPASPALTLETEAAIKKYNVHFVIADFSDGRVERAFPEAYNFVSRGIRFFDASELFEEVFGRMPLSQINEEWVTQNASRYSYRFYDSVKRIMDIVGALVVGTLSLPLYPLIALAIVLDSRGSIVIAQDRVGENNRLVRMYKFRSMSGNDNGKYGPSGVTTLTVTRVGRVLRATRLDELPQLWNVLLGSLSLIGPRSELPPLVAQYERLIPYYGVRHLIKPGLSGWAQLYYHQDPHHAADVEMTKMKLSYDLYYLKHRSLTLDIVVAIKTIRRLLIKSNA